MSKPVVSRHAEAELRRLNRALRMLSDSNQALIRATDEDALLREVCRIAVEVGGYRMAWVGMPEHDERKSVRVAAVAGFETGYLEAMRITWADGPHGRGPAGTAIRTGQPHIMHDLEAEATTENWRKEARARGYRAMAGLPLTSGGRTLGALSVHSADKPAFDEEEMKILTELAGDLAFGLDALRMRAEHARAEELLHRREQEFRAFVENSPDLILRFNRELRETYVNPAMCRTFGVPAAAFLNKPIGAGTLEAGLPRDPAALARIQQCIRTVFATGAPTELEVAWPTVAGVRIYSVRYFPEFDRAGAVSNVLAISRDMTEQRRAELALKNVLRHARTMVMHATVTVPDGGAQSGPEWIAENFEWESRFDDEGVAQDVLPLALAPGERYDEAWNRAKLPDDRRPMALVAARAFHSGATSWQQEFRAVDRDGRLHWFAQVASIEAVGRGRWRVTTTNTDITKRQEAEVAMHNVLLRARAMVMHSVVTAPDGWDQHPPEWSAGRYKWVAYFMNEAAAQEVMPVALAPGEKYHTAWVRARHPEDLPKTDMTAARAFVSGATSWQQEMRTTDRDGRLHWFAQSAAVRVVGPGRWEVTSINTDITERKLAEEAMRARERELRALTENSPDLIARVDREHRYLYVNRVIERLTGVPVVEHLGKRIGEVSIGAQAALMGDSVTRMRAAIDRVFATHGPAELEGRLQLPRRDLVLDGRFVPEFDQSGEVTSVLILARDVTERTRAEEALRRSQHAYASLVTTIDGIVWEADAQTFAFSFVSPQAERILGYPPAQWVEDPKFWAEHLHPDDRERAIAYCVGATEEMRDHDFLYRMVAADGRVVWLHDLVTVVVERGRAVKLRGIMLDVTKSKQAEDALRLFRALIDHTTDAIEVIDPETGRFLDVNEVACREHGYTREEFLRLGVRDLEVGIDLVAPDSWRQNVARIREEGSVLLEGRHRRKDGSTFPVEINANYVSLERDYLVSIVRDITERRHAEEALRESEQRFRQVTETIDEVFWMTDVAKQRMIYISPAYEKIWGQSCAHLYASPQAWLDAVHPDDRERVRQAAMSMQASGLYDLEYRIVRPDRVVRWIHDRAFPIKNASGEVVRVVGVAEDITQRRLLEEQFRQSQKMEAIGQLAGGIAHDFNNLLTVVQMQTSMLLGDKLLDAAAAQSVRQIMDAAMRAANLTRQLLTFSRQSMKTARAIDLGEVVTGTTKLLRRVLGEDISLESQFAPSLPFVQADPGMMEQVLMNLVLNARDAMPRGGRLMLKLDALRRDTDENPARVGRFVCLSVSDTGIGIAPDVLPRIFEPFFTTKEVGKGTGLGLAMVFGIVQQHHGWVEVESEAGRGTTFHVFLPVVERPAELPAPTVTAMPRGGTETVLLAEDEAAVLLVASLALERSGYRVLEAANAAEALALWDEQHGRIDLLVTDLIMPGGMSGQQLAAELRVRCPALKIIFTSGYSRESVSRELQLAPGKNFLPKPYPVEELLAIVRQRLDETAT